jgi:hypothetical protein
MIVILLLIYTLAALSEPETLTSSTIRDNKLIAIYSTIKSLNIKVRSYELKEGTTADIFNSRKTVDFGLHDENFALKFLDIPDNLQEDKNKSWLKFEYQTYSFPLDFPLMKWMGYINLSEMSLENDTDYIKFPTHENFPVRGYTINSIANEFGSALYATGGELYSEKDDRIFVSNSFHKYNFTTKEWMNITYSADGKLRPLTEHKSVVIENRYLVVLGGKRPTNNLRYSISEFVNTKFEYYSLYDLSIFDTFTNSWENVNIKPSIFEAKVSTLQFNKFLAAAYKDKIIVFGIDVAENQSYIGSPIRNLGILDLKSKTWTWTPILNEDGSSYEAFRDEKDIHVLNDQLIICTGKLNFYICIFLLIY